MRSLISTTLCCLLLTCLQSGLAGGCTSFCMDTPDGPVFGANCDLFIAGDGLVFVNRRGMAKEGWNESTTGQTAQWVSTYGSVTLNLAGREFAWCGMNEAGLVMSSMQLLAQECAEPDERPPLADGFFVQYVLDTCGSIEDVLRVDSLVRLEPDECTTHYLVADKDGNCASLEFLDGEFVCHTGDTMPVKALSNMRYAKALAAWERGGARWWWSNPGQSAERFAGAGMRSAAYDASRDTCAVTHAFETLHMVAAGHTRWNVVHDIGRREIHFRSVQSPTVKRVSLAVLDFTCDGLPLMLDVNAPLEGSVETSFRPYDRHANLTVFRRFCDRWGIEVSYEGAVQLMGIFDTFECVAGR